MENISINCIACGECCNSGPVLSIKEMFKYQETFIIGLQYSITTISSQTTPWLKENEREKIRDYLDSTSVLYKPPSKH